jgi:hypothetical protein
MWGWRKFLVCIARSPNDYDHKAVVCFYGHHKYVGITQSPAHNGWLVLYVARYYNISDSVQLSQVKKNSNDFPLRKSTVPCSKNVYLTFPSPEGSSSMVSANAKGRNGSPFQLPRLPNDYKKGNSQANRGHPQD